jgi:Cyclic nucleotide-binding domain
VAASRPALRRLDRELRVRDADIDVLRAVPMLGALPTATIEQLGARLAYAEFAAGQLVFEQGDRGDRFYAVETRRAEVVRDGRLVNTLGRSDGFGEIALLGDGPRTATIRPSASAPLRVGIVERPAFLIAVTGYPVSATAGNGVVARVQARDAGRLALGTDDGGEPFAGTAEGSAD